MTRTPWLWVALGLVLLLPAGCDCAGRVTGGPCDAADRPSGCGQSCSGGRMCPAGTYCGPGSLCTADCSASAPCAAGATCQSGRCVGAMPMDGGEVPRPDAMGIDNTCAAVRLEGNRTTPNVIIVIDRSGSMDRDFDAGMTRWETLQSSLLAMPDGVIFSLQASVRFGIAMYTQQTAIAGCPDLFTVPCALDNYSAIQAEYTMRTPGGGTPTGDSIQAILSMIGTLAPERADPTILILATDGEPDTCEDGNDEVGGRRESLEAVQAAFAMGIRTYAISVGTDVGMAHLQDVANAGLGRMPGDPDAPFWVATDTAGLVDALETIVGGVVSCVVELEGMIDPAQACSGTVMLGSETLACGTDWRATDATHIELLGAACDRLQSTGDPLTATFPCGAVIF